MERRIGKSLSWLVFRVSLINAVKRSGVSAMRVPQHVRPFPNNEILRVDDFATSSTMNGDVDSMVVPDRILVAGGRAIIGEKQPPPEIALDLHTLPPVRYSHKVLETPPAKLTLHERTFPTVVDGVEEVPAFRYRRSSTGSDKKPEEAMLDRLQNSSKPIQFDGLPSSSTLSLLTPAEELVLLRSHVRKLTTRVTKLEENMQDLNTHLGWIESLGGALLLIVMLKSLKNLFWK